MKGLLALLVAAFVPAAALAQYTGPAAETCRSYAEKEIRKGNDQVKAIVFDQDTDLQIARYTRNVGSQFVSSLLEGNGAILYAGGRPVEFRFLCLLAQDKRAVFFHWTPRRDASPLLQCRRGGASTEECLNALHELAESELTQLYAKHYTEALQAGGEPAADKFRRSADAWKTYRDAECGRRAKPQEQKACVVAMMRQRAADLR
ncbi:MAG TPA: lysozyme inhibitor LprI family protein [Burkholderiales bacterium]|nr:lysozyme inhibitor LprI family protein [Burkholderiales bacterium]